MEFMIGIYDVDRSGDTDRMRMRGSGRDIALSAGLLEIDGLEIRFMSCMGMRFQEIATSETTHSKVLL